MAGSGITPNSPDSNVLVKESFAGLDRLDKRVVQNIVQKKARGNHDPLSFYLNTTDEHNAWLKPDSHWWIPMVGSQKNDRRLCSFSCWPDIDLGSNRLYRIFYDHDKRAWITDRT